MSPQKNGTVHEGPASTLRQHCERILKELEQLYAQSPRKSLDESIQQVKALMARLPKDDPPHQ